MGQAAAERDNGPTKSSTGIPLAFDSKTAARAFATRFFRRHCTMA
jgi:hypothetical protein